MKDPAFVKFRGIVKQFDGVTAVENIDLDIAEGDLVTLLGPSGCGKTTLLRMLAGLETPTAGEMFIKGKRINDTPVHKRNLGMIFQNYALFPHKTIFDNVAFGLKYRNIPRDQIREKVINTLEMVRLPGVEHRKPSQLSGGQQQRIALARAIVIEPDVLLMDEPLSALDENLREEMRREIDNLQQKLGITTIFVTHDQREALCMSHKIVVMKNGTKLQEGTPQEVYNYPVNHFVADFLGHSNFIDVIVQEIDERRVKVILEDGEVMLANPAGDFRPGDNAEVVVRAQKLMIGLRADFEHEEHMNAFWGTIIDRSYMGGEVSYFVEIESKQVFHVIDLVDRAPFIIGDEVFIKADPEYCRLLKS
jgi:putative spermidine/putrescine transport system ATP-binding protein/spermidine/putrescine transport system ATP-binding protein